MSTRTETIRVRIFPGVRVWQAMLVAAALVASLLLGLALGRASAPVGTDTTFDSQDFAPYMCTGHVQNPACELKVARGYGHTAHVPPGGPAAYGE
jgi:hypothetical protein